MKEIVIEIESKLKGQVDHVFNIHSTEMLKTKVYDLAFEWYLKGLSCGIECERKDQDSKRKKVFLLFNVHNETFEGVYAQRKDAEDMIESFGKDRDKFKVEEHEVIQ